MTTKNLLMTAPAAGGGSFTDPTDIGWHSLFWAEGPAFVAQGYSDTNSVTNWPNETAESDASTVAGTGPTYDAVHASFNDQPVVAFGGAGRIYTAAFSSAPSYASGVSLVVIAKRTSAGATRIMVDGGNGASAAQRNAVYADTTGKWALFAGSAVTNGTPDNNTHFHVAKFDGSTGNDTLTVDGTLTVNGSAGSGQILATTIGANPTGAGPWLGEIALYGIYEGDVTADGMWADFISWVETHYGLTIA